MVENQTDADADADEGFGDFQFVSFSNQPLQSDQNERVDEDEWGDFMDDSSRKQDFFGNSVRFDPFNAFNHTQNSLKSPETSQSFDLFGILSDHSTISPGSKPSFVDSEKNSASPVKEKQWEKPRGALPLSFFGDEEEESDPINSSFNEDADNLSVKPAASSVKNGSNFGAVVGLNDLIANLYGQAELTKSVNGSNSSLVNGDMDFDDNDWEFKDALDGNRVGNGDSAIISDSAIKVDITSGLLGIQVETTTIHEQFQVDGKKSENSEGSLHTFGYNGLDSGELFVASDGLTKKSAGFDNGLGLETSVITQNGFISDSFNQAKPTETGNGLTSYSVDANEDTDDNTWEFKDAISESGAVNFSWEHKEEQKVAALSDGGMKVPAFDAEVQGNGGRLGNHQGALPLSIFTNGELDSDNFLYTEDVSSHNPATYVRNGTYSQGFSQNVSFNDLISTLYSQAEQIPAIESTGKSTKNGLSSAQIGVNSDLVNGEDDFDESSWEFTDAFSESRAEGPQYLFSLGDADKNSPSELQMKTFVDFYSRLKEESCFLALCRLDDLKKAQKVAALSGEDAKAIALDEEIQAAQKKLYLENMVSKVYPEELSTRNICVDVLKQERNFQVLESEYQLLKRISLAEMNLTSAIELYEHVILMLKILTLGSLEEQSKYVTTWSKMISACAQELKHGALIWKQSLLKNVHRKILSEHQGQRYFLALGELYRVVEILRASTTLYKPWILSCLLDPSVIFATLEECMAAWSDTGLEEAVHSISDPVSSGYDGTIEGLLKSIRSVHDLDALVLQNHLFSQREPICQLSRLPLAMVSDMKVVVWNGEHYFLTLANLWANRISCDPPELPHIRIS